MMTPFEIEILVWERLTKWLREADEIRKLCESRGIQVPHLLNRFFGMINQMPAPSQPTIEPPVEDAQDGER